MFKTDYRYHGSRHTKIAWTTYAINGRNPLACLNFLGQYATSGIGLEFRAKVTYVA